MEIREYSDVTAKGRNLYAFINAVRQSDIRCGEQHCKGGTFRCRILRADERALQTLADSQNITLRFNRRRSLLGIFQRYRLRFGILIGVILGGCIIFYQSNVVQSIEITGNQKVYESVIRSVLEQEGIRQGVWIPDIDMTHCERAVRAVIPDIAWCGIRHTGNHIFVQVTEITPNTPMRNERTPCNIVAAVDAKITDVRVYSGHLQRLIGDGVAKGDMIVSGVFQDQYGITTFHHAIASVTGIYTKETELTERFRLSETVPTGKSFRQRWLKVFGIRIPLTIGSPDYDDYKETERETSFFIFSRELPCGIVQRITEEQKTVDTVRSEEETELALHADIVRYEKNILNDVTILDRQIEYIRTEEGITCRIRYQVEGEIGLESDIYIK